MEYVASTLLRPLMMTAFEAAGTGSGILLGHAFVYRTSNRAEMSASPTKAGFGDIVNAAEPDDNVFLSFD